jgi:hypothetical protein
MGDQQETPIEKHYTKASINFSFLSSFDKAVKVIVRLENSPYFIKLTQVNITKSPKNDDLARVSVSIIAETVLSKEK